MGARPRGYACPGRPRPAPHGLRRLCAGTRKRGVHEHGSASRLHSSAPGHPSVTGRSTGHGRYGRDDCGGYAWCWGCWCGDRRPVERAGVFRLDAPRSTPGEPGALRRPAPIPVPARSLPRGHRPHSPARVCGPAPRRAARRPCPDAAAPPPRPATAPDAPAARGALAPDRPHRRRHRVGDDQAPAQIPATARPEQRTGRDSADTLHRRALDRTPFRTAPPGPAHRPDRPPIPPGREPAIERPSDRVRDARATDGSTAPCERAGRADGSFVSQ